MWKPIEIGTVVAERKLTFQSDDLQKNVTLVVGQPVRPDIADESDPWWCPIQLRGLDDRVHSIAGEDSLQALVLALEFARTLLTTTAKDDGGTVLGSKMTWIVSRLRGQQLRLIHRSLPRLYALPSISVRRLLAAIAREWSRYARQSRR